jgi:hypothetical protein
MKKWLRKLYDERYGFVSICVNEKRLPPHPLMRSTPLSRIEESVILLSGAREMLNSGRKVNSFPVVLPTMRVQASAGDRKL